MLEISTLKIEGLEQGRITDRRPNISFALRTDVQGEALCKAVISVDDWTCETTDQINNLYG